ncbi:hypothetical protein CCACVL1_04871 [Corchorus capsularis]|uniref:Uncharacterized protein n=1 Tax=Corchorus capsularis TaxID=210143 RepID=A0A1R3JP04_COCAP|nr:hypothetical protein CCACVL1_04871 [Corchorus capsularis]
MEKQCVVSNGTGNVLTKAFEAFSRVSFDEHVAVLEEILFALTIMFPLETEADAFLGGGGVRCAGVGGVEMTELPLNNRICHHHQL